MYGLVNKAVEQMVCSAHGEQMWERIRTLAGVEEDGFVSNESYPDDTTYKLVAAASEALATPAEDILRAFGEHWVLHTALESYGPMMRTNGKTLEEFLMRLPHLHNRVELIYPRLQPPQFTAKRLGPAEVEVHYSTARPAGLEPFVEGLLHGLGKMYSIPVEVSLLQDRRAGAEASIFLVRWTEAA